MPITYYPTFKNSSGNVGIGNINPGFRLDIKALTTNGSTVFVIRNANDANNTVFYDNGTVSAGSDFRAPIFYDSNDTAYYVNPNSVSNLSSLRIFSAFDTASSDVYANMRVMRNNATTDGMYIGYGNSGSTSALTRIFGGGATTGELSKYSNYTLEPGSFRSPIFYDSDNTGYYLDAASTSNLNALIVAASTRIGGAASRSTSGLTVGFTDNSTFAANTDVGDTDRMLSIVNESSTTNAMAVLGFRVNPNGGTANAMLDIKFVQTGATNTSGLHYTFNHGGSFLDRFSILSSGNVGIGTVSPTQVLDVRGNIKLGADSAGNYVYYVKDNEGSIIRTTRTDVTQEGLFRSDGWGNFTFNNNIGVGLSLGTGYGVGSVGSGIVYANGSVRAPIFYDSNNTAYYIDAAGTSVLNALTVGGNTALTTASTLTAGNLSGTIPSGVLGNSTVYIGTTAIALNRGSASQSLTGINIDGNSGTVTYSPSRTDSTAYPVLWGAGTSTTLAYSCASVYIQSSTGSLYANTFYDAGNTAYYCDPASTSNLNNLTVAGTMTFGTLAYTVGSRRSKNSSNVDIETVTGLVSPSGPTFLEIRGFCPPAMYRTTGDRPAPYGLGFGNGSESGGIMPIGAGDNLQEIMLYGANSGPTTFTFKRQIWEGNAQDPSFSNYYGSSVFSINTGTGVVTASTDIRSPIYYDSDNTAFYINAAGTSVINALSLSTLNNMNAATGVWHTSVEGKGRFYFESSGTTYVKTANNFIFRNNSDSGVFTIDSSGNIRTTTGGDNYASFSLHVGGTGFASSDFRAPIFYDSGDTTYYIDPASFSLISSMGIGGLTSSNNVQMYDSYVDASSSYLQSPPLIIRKDNSATGAIDQAPVGLFIYNLNGTNNTWTKLSMGSREAAGAGNTVSIAGLAAQKTAGTANGWATGNLHFWTKAGGTQITNMIAYSSGYIQSGYSFRAPIFYDSDNTSYYIDAASTSNLVGLTVVNTITGSITGNAGGSSASCTGNAATATILQTARNINGTSFNGSAAITTATWGTARTLTIGSTGKSVDGSANVSWNLAELGAAATNQTMFIGTTSVAINRSSASQTLTGVSIDGNSATTTLATKATRANGDFYIDDNYGNTVVGLYSATRLQGVFAMGNSYKLTADGTGVGTLYGLAWSHPNFGGVAANLADHGLLILQNGVFKGAWGGGSFRTPGDIRGTLFYDWDNTGYYCDPASTSNLNAITAAGNITAAQYYTGGWFRNNSSGNGLYNETTGQHFYSDSANYWNIASSASAQGIRLRTGGHNGTVRGYFYADTNNHVGILNQDGNWRLRVVGGDYSLADGSSMRAQIFYDSNDTSYYVDPNSGSNLVSITNRENLPGGSGNTYYWSGSAMSFYWTKIANVGGGNTHAAILITYKTDVNYNPFGLALLSVSAFNSQTFSVKLEKLNGDSMQILIRVDNNNDVWLLTAAEWSSYKTWKVISKLGSPTIYYSSLTEQLTTPANSIEIASGQEVRGNQGAATSATVSTVANHLFGGLTVRSDVRAPIFYDSDDTAFYLDPAGTSNLNKFSTLTMSYNDMNSMHVNSPYVNRYNGSSLYRNGTMGYGTVDCNVMFSNWGSGFIDSWSSPANAPGGSTHYVGLQGFHYNHVNNSQAYGFQMLCAGEADNRFFWRSAWPNLRSWVEMIHSGNIGSQTVATAGSCTGNSATVTNGVYTTGDQSIGGAKTFTRINFGATGSTPYSSAAGEGFGNGITFGGDENSGYYRIFTTMENVGGNYSKLALNWHTGIRIGAYPNYGGVRFYNNAFGNGTEIFSVGSLDSNVRVVNTIYAQSFYDINNTAYYVDPNSTSNIVGLTVANTITGSVSGGSGSVDSNTGNVGGNKLQYWQVSGNTTLNPDGEWYNAIRMGHGDPVTYYSNTLAIRMTGGNLGDIYTRTTTNGTAGTWNRFWHNNNDGAGSGLDADLLDGYASATANTVNTIVLRDSSGNFSAGTITAALSGNSTTATTLQTARNINGTSFNGSAAITTATWGTARTITIGSTGKSVDGSASVSWSLAELGAAATNQTMFIGTTSVAINRSSASQTLTGISIDGNAATVTNGVYTGTTNTLTGVNYFRSDKGSTSTVGANSNYALQAFSNDAGAAGMSFHRGGYYAVNMGLDPDNIMRIGGWSASANRWELDMSGNNWVASSFRAPIFYDSNNTGYYLDPNSTTSLRTVGSWRSDSSTWDGEFSGKIQYHSNHWYIQAADLLIYRNSGGSNVFTVNQSGVAIASADMRAPIFYDNNDTGYYLDPNSTSNLLLVRTRNTFGERVAVSATASTTINTQYNVTELTLAATITTLTLSNIQASGIVHMWTIVTVGGGVGYSITWPAAVKWPGGTAPTLTTASSKRDIYQFVTYDGGTNIYAIIVGQNL
jgi:hypothetical protein